MPDESEQAKYMSELLATFEDVGVDSALWFTFGAYHLRRDRDVASHGLVTMLDEYGSRWEPKQSFHALASANAG